MLSERAITSHVTNRKQSDSLFEYKKQFINGLNYKIP